MSKGRERDPHLGHKPICTRCGSKETRYLRKTNTIYCRGCGFEWPAPWVDAPTSKRKHTRREGG